MVTELVSTLLYAVLTRAGADVYELAGVDRMTSIRVR